MPTMIEKVANTIYREMTFGHNLITEDIQLKRHYYKVAKAAIEAIVSNVYHEAQDTDFDIGFEEFRNILKENIK